MSNLTTYVMAIVCLVAGFAVGSVALPVAEADDTGSTASPRAADTVASAAGLQGLETVSIGSE